MLLYCALVGARLGPIDIDIDASLPVSKLKKAIVAEKARRIQCDADELQLFYAKNKEGWLRSDNQHVKKMFEGAIPDEIRALLINPIDALTTIDAAFAEEFTQLAIHVLAVDPTANETLARRLKRNVNEMDNDQVSSSMENQMKRVRLDPDVIPDSFRQAVVKVPIESIDVYRHIKDGFSIQGSSPPLFVMYGPHQFGKTSIANYTANFIDTNFTDVNCIFVNLFSGDIINKANFWSRLVKWSPRSQCHDQDSFFKLVTRGHDRFCLILDKMDLLSKNNDVASILFTALRSWKQTSSFFGFLGVGNHSLLRHLDKWDANEQPHPFDAAQILRVQPFSVEQMSSLFTQIPEAFSPPESLKQGIIQYSRGSPGIFMSLIQFTAENNMLQIEHHEWESWLMNYAFREYLDGYPRVYKRVQEDLRTLTQWQWDALNLVLLNPGILNIHEVEERCDIPAAYRGRETVLDPLLRMGVAIRGMNGTFAVVSEIMKRICLITNPVRVIREAASTNDPFHLLSVALQHLDHRIINHVFSGNRHAASEASFQFELYRYIYDILHKWQPSERTLVPEARHRRRRVDILMSNGHTLAYELKSNCIEDNAIKLAEGQAERYRKMFEVDHMVVVNFVPERSPRTACTRKTVSRSSSHSRSLPRYLRSF